MKKKNFPLGKVYRLLEPGPVLMVTTAHRSYMNVMTISWHTMVDFNPPLVACIVGDQSRTFAILKKTKECVLNIPTVELARKAVSCGRISGEKVDKFKAFGLTPQSASLVQAPLVGECYANFECKVVDMRMAARYNLFILKVLKAWIDPKAKTPKTIHHIGGDTFVVDGRTIEVHPEKI